MQGEDVGKQQRDGSAQRTTKWGWIGRVGVFEGLNCGDGGGVGVRVVASGAIRSQRWFRPDSLCILQPSSYPNGSSFIWSCWKLNHKSKKYTSAQSKNPSRASLRAYWVGLPRMGKREGAGVAVSVNNVLPLPSFTACSQQKGRKRGRGSRGKKVTATWDRLCKNRHWQQWTCERWQQSHTYKSVWRKWSVAPK